MAMIDWSDPEVGKMVEQTFTLGNHNSLCLAHGREPIIPVSTITGGPRIARIQIVRFHYSAVNLLVPKYSILN